MHRSSRSACASAAAPGRRGSRGPPATTTGRTPGRAPTPRTRSGPAARTSSSCAGGPGWRSRVHFVAVPPGRPSAAAAARPRPRRRPRQAAQAGAPPPIIPRADWAGTAHAARRARLRRRAGRLRPPHGVGQRLHRGRRARDRVVDGQVPPRRQRVERPGLQLRRRPVRAGLRGPRGRRRPGRDRRAGPGLQRALDRDRQHRDVHRRRPDRRGAGRDGAADRLEAAAARRAGRRPGRHHLGRRRDQPLQVGHARDAATDLRPPRRRRDRVPGQHVVRPAAGPPGARRADRAGRDAGRRARAGAGRAARQRGLRLRPDGLRHAPARRRQRGRRPARPGAEAGHQRLGHRRARRHERRRRLVGRGRLARRREAARPRDRARRRDGRDHRRRRRLHAAAERQGEDDPREGRPRADRLGTVRPLAPVYVKVEQQGSDGRWRTIRTQKVSPRKPAFSAKVPLSKPGLYRLTPRTGAGTATARASALYVRAVRRTASLIGATPA